MDVFRIPCSNQESLGLDVDDNKMVIGLISRLTNQKGLDIVNDVIPGIMVSVE